MSLLFIKLSFINFLLKSKLNWNLNAFVETKFDPKFLIKNRVWEQCSTYIDYPGIRICFVRFDYLISTTSNIHNSKKFYMFTITNKTL